MVIVIADIQVVEGKRAEFLEIFNALVPKEHAEEGCIEYGPTVDVATDIEQQQAVNPNVVTVVEKWKDVDSLKAHLVAPHMTEFRDSAGDLIAGLNLRIVEPAS